MRIIGGNKGGIRINIPKNLKLRPTTDRSKEALFNILNNKIDYNQLYVLDLFSGTGNISYEFSSRGAEYVCSVEKNQKSVEFINHFKEINDLNIEAIKKDVFNFLNSTNKKFNVIFADPPYNLKEEDYYNLINIIFDKEIIKINGTLIIEHSSKTLLDKHDYHKDSRKYGDCSFSFYKKLNNWLSGVSLLIFNLLYKISIYYLFLL